MSPSGRRFVGALFQIGLVVVAIGIFASYVRHRLPHKQLAHVEAQMSAADSLGPEDLRIYSADSSIDLVLKGNQLLTGLSPKTVAKVRAELDTSGSGGSIGRLVKQTVASAIGTHVAYQLADIRDVHYVDGKLVFDWADGHTQDLFGNTKVNGNKVSNMFRAEDAKHLIDAIHARKAAMPPMPSMPAVPAPAKPPR